MSMLILLVLASAVGLLSLAAVGALVLLLVSRRNRKGPDEEGGGW